MLQWEGRCEIHKERPQGQGVGFPGDSRVSGRSNQTFFTQEPSKKPQEVPLLLEKESCHSSLPPGHCRAQGGPGGASGNKPKVISVTRVLPVSTWLNLPLLRGPREVMKKPQSPKVLLLCLLLSSLCGAGRADPAALRGHQN